MTFLKKQLDLILLLIFASIFFYAVTKNFNDPFVFQLSASFIIFNLLLFTLLNLYLNKKPLIISLSILFASPLLYLCLGYLENNNFAEEYLMQGVIISEIYYLIILGYFFIKYKINLWSLIKTNKKILSSSVIIFSAVYLLLFLQLFKEVKSQPLNNSLNIPTNDNPATINNQLSVLDIKNKVINLLQNSPEDTLAKDATLFLLTGDIKNGNDYKIKYLDYIQQLSPDHKSFSVKGGQYIDAIYGHYFIQIKQKYPELFTVEEIKNITNTYITINKKIYEPELVDLMYGKIFNHQPTGLYVNQEIGHGYLAVLTRIIKNTDQDLYRKNQQYLTDNAIGWSDNYRNPDDSIFYQNLWMTNAFFLAEYSDLDKFSNPDNLKKSFEWLLGVLPNQIKNLGLNDPYPSSYFDSLFYGLYALQDQQLLASIDSMMDNYQNERGNQQANVNYQTETLSTLATTYLIEQTNQPANQILHFTNSNLLLGTTGLAIKPETDQVDKFVFKWQNKDDNLYALINLRNHGWHKYKNLGGIVSLIYNNQPIIAENIISRDFLLMPKARSLYRDKKINKTELNVFYSEAGWLGKFLFKIHGFNSQFSQNTAEFVKIDKYENNDDSELIELSYNEGKINYSRTYILDKKNKVFNIINKFTNNKNKKNIYLATHFLDKLFINTGNTYTNNNKTFSVQTTTNKCQVEKLKKDSPSAGEIHDIQSQIICSSDQESDEFVFILKLN